MLASWDEAIASCASLEWENLCLEAANRYREQLQQRDQARFNQWNNITGELRPITKQLVARKIAKVVQENQLPKVFQDTVNWDILAVAMEAEYADVFQPGFYASQAYWYVQGHFPCGWQGDFPDGKLIIY